MARQAKPVALEDTGTSELTVTAPPAILMVAAENGTLPGGKVGGMGDVLRDVPRALAARGHRVTVVTPAYGAFQRLPKMKRRGEIITRFRGREERLALYALPPAGPGRRLRTLVLDHPLFAACGEGRIYCDDPADQPFARDSSKFALFCAAVASGLVAGQFDNPAVVHLHDWHAAGLAVLLRRHPAYAGLAETPLVLTLHNLAMQGVRPLAWHEHSLQAWFPGLAPDSDLVDPRYGDCYNPLRAAIRMVDRVHVVSPSYAREICAPDGNAGEGLQADLSEALAEGRLHGILNGCEYPGRPGRLPGYVSLLDLARNEVLRWIGIETHVRTAHLLALERLDAALEGGLDLPERLLTLVGRLTDQKVGLLMERLDDGRPVLAHLLGRLGNGEQLIVLGSGAPAIEQTLASLAATEPRLLFLCGYSEPLSEQLYASGDLFLMPSRFEPCGISQMLAMRAGQPCLVHRTGGLADTVQDGVDGFAFDGEDDAARVAALMVRFDDAMLQLRDKPKARARMRKAAAAARFPWDTVAADYDRLLYDVAVKSGSAN